MSAVMVALGQTSARLRRFAGRVSYKREEGRRARCCAPPPSTEETTVTDVVKKTAGLLVVAFAVFYLLTSPEAAADAVRGAGSAVATGFEKFIQFCGALVS